MHRDGSSERVRARIRFAVAFIAVVVAASATLGAEPPTSGSEPEAPRPLLPLLPPPHPSKPALGRFAWTCGPVLISPAPKDGASYHAIKDPTVVHTGGRSHVYATRKGKEKTVMESLSFAEWREAEAAPRHPIELVPAYHCAPQLFFFTPRKTWFLIYQWGDDARKYFGPAYSTLEDPSKPETLTRPVMLYPEKPAGVDAWLDFWVIGDPATRSMHLFFTSLDGRMWRAQTSYADFPHGWSPPRVVLRGDIFEASHTYALAGQDRYLTIIEAQGPAGRRYYKAYLADRLDGEWKPIADSYEAPFAGESNVRFAEGVESWTDCVSHGELLREGVDETMTVDPKRLRFLFQGSSAAGREGKGYGAIPWRLGMLEATETPRTLTQGRSPIPSKDAPKE